MIEVIIDFLILGLLLKISIIVEEAKELIDELNDDIAAESAPANINPLNPGGIYSRIYIGKILLVPLPETSKLPDNISVPTHKNTKNWIKTNIPLPIIAFLALDILLVLRTL